MHTQPQNEVGSEPTPASYDVVGMARAQSQTKAHMKSRPTSNASEQGKNDGTGVGVQDAGPSIGQRVINAKWQSMTKRLSMAS